MSKESSVCLSAASLFEIERACIKHLSLGFGVSAQRLGRWSEFEVVNGFVAGIGAFIFFLSDDRAAYILWHYATDGTLSFPDVEIVPDFVYLKLPEGVKWERTSEQMNEADLATVGVA